MKKCTKCQKFKLIKEFIKNKQCKNGTANICKICQNEYSKNWKRKNSERLAAARRQRYKETEGLEVKKREALRKIREPLRRRAQVLRQGMIQRSKEKGLLFDDSYFTVSYLMDQLQNNPFCLCCKKKLDITFKEDKKFKDCSPSMDRVNSTLGYVKNNTAIICWRCNKHKQDSTSNELRIIAEFIDNWGDDVCS